MKVDGGGALGVVAGFALDAEQLPHAARVAQAPVLEVVVEEHVRRPGALGQLLDPGDPAGELLLRVQVLEAVGRARGARLPRVRVASVKPYVGEAGGGRRERRRARGEALGLVDGDVGEPRVLEGRERARGGVVAHPAAAPELDRDLQPGEPPGKLAQVRLVVARAHEPVRELEEDGAELAGLMEGRERVAVQLPDGLDEVVRDARAVEPRLGP